MAEIIEKKNSNTATVGYEAKLWQIADALRDSMDAAEYKHVGLGLVFLKYISVAFEELHAKFVQSVEFIRAHFGLTVNYDTDLQLNKIGSLVGAA
jgi:type I restriction enzyme M protein